MTSNTVHVQKERHSSSWLGNSVRWFVVHEPVNIHTLQSYITISLLWDYGHTMVCESVQCMQRRVCCYRWLVQARSPELHRNKSLTVFFLRCGKVGGGCLGFQRGAVWCEFRALTAWGKKLLSSLAERALILRYRLPEGRSWKRLWEGWVGSSTILFALLEHRVRKISKMEGRLHSIKWCVFQQDNAKPHTAAITTAWLRSRRVRVLNWPACSPDLSPIENVWCII